MKRLSRERRAFAIETFFINNDSATLTRVFRRNFDIGRNGRVPTRQTILNWVKEFRTTASAVDRKSPGHPPTISQIPQNMLQTVMNGVMQSVELCLNSSGAHLSDVIFKK
jgi:hypothetical protein